MDPKTPPCLSVEKLSITFGNRCVLDDVSLSIGRGSVTAIIGPSGCGKTSFLNCFNRLVDMNRDCRVAGNILFDGNNIRDGQTDLVALRRRIGMIFQKANPFPFSIWRNLELPLREHGIRSREERQARIEGALRDVGLWDEVHDRLDRPAQSLSGGQQQRLCIARAMVLQPEVLLMDEPCSALDPMAAEVVEKLIRRLRGRLTVLIVTHNLNQARRIADQVGVFWLTDGVGRLIEFGDSEQIFDEPAHPLTAAYVSGETG